jgi:hypothetical protein
MLQIGPQVNAELLSGRLSQAEMNVLECSNTRQLADRILCK